jgi:hypothetical protein
MKALRVSYAWEILTSLFSPWGLASGGLAPGPVEHPNAYAGTYSLGDEVCNRRKFPTTGTCLCFISKRMA